MKLGKIIGWDAEEFRNGVEKTYTIEIGNKTGIVGHGDVTSHAFQTHDGNFQFGEDTISVPGGGGGAQYGTDGTLTKGGENQYNPSGD